MFSMFSYLSFDYRNHICHKGIIIVVIYLLKIVMLKIVNLIITANNITYNHSKI